MWSTFLAMTRINLREKTGLFWMFCFPIILATLLQGVFGNMNEANVIEPVSVAVVRDEAWSKAAGAEEFVKSLAGDRMDSQSVSLKDTQVSQTDANDSDDGGFEVSDDTEVSRTGTRLIRVREVADEAAARRMLADGDVLAMLMADDESSVILSISASAAGQVQAAKANGGNQTSITLSALANAVDAFNTQRTTIAAQLNQAIKADPTLASDPARLERLTQAATSDAAASQQSTAIREITLTHFKPDPMARYHFALLGMAAMMGMLFACSSIVQLQANLSDSGARLSAGPLPKARMAIGVFLSGWLMSFLSLSVAFLYIRFALGITVGGREWLAELGILVASFIASALGLALGAVPKLTIEAKNAVATTLSVGLAALTGLMGVFSMQINDRIAQSAPILHLISPVKQVSELFYDLLYYDSLAPFAATIGRLLVMGGIGLVLSVILLRRHRYAHL